MTEQFDLSKKKNKIDRLIYADKLAKEKLGCGINGEVIFVKDVKEFIRELKKDANKIFEDSYTLTKYQFDKILKERAGKELIEDNQLNQTGGNTKNGNN